MSSTIKTKKGFCIDCKDGKEKPLTAKRCQTHYWKHREKVNKEKNKDKKAWKAEKRKELNVFFANQILALPNNCEECNASLKYWKTSKLIKATIAHILPKRENGFPSVATHPMNRMFFCPDCHTNFDNGDSKDAEKMKSLPIIS